MSEEEFSNTGEISEAAAHPAPDFVEQAPQDHSHEEKGLVSALQAERQQRQHLQEQIQMLNEQVSYLHNQNATPKQKNPLDEVADDDLLTVGMGKNYTSSLMKQFKDEVEELKISMRHPDYPQTVKKFLPKLLEKNPNLRNVITKADNPYETAYYLATHSEDYIREKAVARTPEAQKILDQQNRTGNLSSTGTTAPKGQVSAYKNLSDKEFKTLVNKNLGYF
jgi:hypothetical protein